MSSPEQEIVVIRADLEERTARSEKLKQQNEIAKREANHAWPRKISHHRVTPRGAVQEIQRLTDAAEQRTVRD